MTRPDRFQDVGALTSDATMARSTYSYAKHTEDIAQFQLNSDSITLQAETKYGTESIDMP